MWQGSKQQSRALLDSPYGGAILCLNYRPLDWVHPDWLGDIPFIDYLRALRCARTQEQVRRHLQSGQRSVFLTSETFNDPLRRLLLLPGEKLQRLLTLLGLSCFQKQVALLVEKRVKQWLTELVGETELVFLQHKLPLLITRYPPALESELPLAAMMVKEQMIKESPTFIAYGERLLCLACDGEGEEAWRQALRYKQPKCEHSPFTTVSLNRTEQERLRILIKKMALELEPACTTLLK